ncbi:TetR/AcrR family transcriptional regulator [Longispora albida]|uniref:TetR/AcrR family transcriptional regulator n=1 Tax=Longispora albida TaxID=203523 RepID=UPI0003AA395A|nr:TetR/AcrR family transcriptional regulator [Longispora albida]
MDRRARQRDQTRATLVAQARRLFAERGYAEVSLAEIAAAASVTKGAVFHNFASKAELFTSVAEQVHAEVAERVAAAATGETWPALLAGCRAFLGVGREPEIARILLIDGPVVLGWAAWRAMDRAGSGQLLAEGLTELITEGVLPPQPVEPLACLLSGAMNEAALWLATEPGADLAAVVTAFEAMLEGLRHGRDRRIPG